MMERTRGLMAILLVGFIKAYQITLSRMLGSQCRFHPSCSVYALEAIEVHGPWRGTVMAIGRVLRCHTFHPGGLDPVPPRAGWPR